MSKRVLGLVDFNSNDEDFVDTHWMKKKKKIHRVLMKKRRGKFWRVTPSIVMFDARFEVEDMGLGVFAIRPGRFRIHFRDCLHVSKTHMGEWVVSTGYSHDI